jgi:tetratricopeptide (TPR) repeat protein
MRRAVLISFLLLGATVAAYWPIREAEFLNFDDAQYITDNPKVLQGLTRQGFVWSFTTFHASNWHPLTWLSHMADCQLFGDNPTGHHFANVGLHAANAILLFFLLWRMTGAQARSAFVAALFALHPLHVESVAWISERKDVLSVFFGLLTLGAYVEYARAAEGPRPKARKFYGAALICFGLGLLSKPMLVTLPCLMLLLDFWPLGRLHTGDRSLATGTLGWLLREKIPFLLLAAASAIITFLAQKHGGAVVKMDVMPLDLRLMNATVSCAWYLAKAIWPVNLGPYYAYPVEMAAAPVLAAAATILGLSVIAWRLARRAPYVLVGWVWFLVSLLPVIGLIQVGSQARADRYTYLPLTGVFVAAVWGAGELLARWQHGRAVGMGAGLVVLASGATATFFQVQYWKNGVTVFERALAVSPENNVIALHNLAHAYALQGNRRQAIAAFQEALRLRPDYPQAHFNLGNIFAVEGRLDDAIEHYREAIRLKPQYAEAYYNLGRALAQQGRWPWAEKSFLAALRGKPDYGDAMTRLGNLLLLEGDEENGLRRLFEAVQIDPQNPESHYYLATALAQRRRFAEAVSHFRAAMKLQPKYLSAMNDLAWILATQNDPAIRNVPEALELARRVCDLTRNRNPSYLDTLAVALSEAERFDQAVEIAGQAVSAAEHPPYEDLRPQLVAHLDAFRRGRRYRDVFSKDAPPGDPAFEVK